jgi:hypothetical protein
MEAPAKQNVFEGFLSLFLQGGSESGGLQSPVAGCIHGKHWKTLSLG